jgi:prepilin-type N-terminal cleavage/methylation domain-containing protein
MRVLRCYKNNDGFTLVETLIVLVIVGILLAIATPSFLAMNNKAKLNDALNTVRGAMLEAQREAMRKSKNCTVTLNATTNKITSSDGCLVTGDRTLPQGIILAYNGSDTINYGMRGNTTTNKTIRLSLADGSGQTKCLAVSLPLGIIRLGIYDANATPPCKKP